MKKSYEEMTEEERKAEFKRIRDKDDNHQEYMAARRKAQTALSQKYVTEFKALREFYQENPTASAGDAVKAGVLKVAAVK